MHLITIRKQNLYFLLLGNSPSHSRLFDPDPLLPSPYCCSWLPAAPRMNSSNLFIRTKSPTFVCQEATLPRNLIVTQSDTVLFFVETSFAKSKNDYKKIVDLQKMVHHIISFSRKLKGFQFLQTFSLEADIINSRAVIAKSIRKAKIHDQMEHMFSATK